MYRVPLWPVRPADSHQLGGWQATDIPMLDIHELAAGKLAALLSRGRARDLFDCRQLFLIDTLDPSRLRTAFVVYGAMNRRDWRTVTVDDVAFDPRELSSQLLPSLPASAVAGMNAAGYGRMLVEHCQRALSVLLPFDEAERAFLDLLLDHGEIDGALLTTDQELQQRINAQPWLEWKAQNVRRHQGLP